MTAQGHCPDCGTARAADAVFCVSCGFSLPPVEPVTEAPASPASGGEATPADDAPPLAAHAGPAETFATAAESTAHLPVAHLAALVVGVSLGVAAVAVALTLALAPPAPGTSGPSGTVGGLRVVEVENIRAEVPMAWDVVTRARDTIVVQDEARRALWLRSANLPTAIALDAIQERYLSKARDESPDARICAGPDVAAVPGGSPDGRYFVICSTFIQQGGGPAARLADAYYVAVGGASTTIVVMQLTAVPEALEAFAGVIRQLPVPVWKLLGG